MLRAIHRVLQPGGRVSILVIALAPGIDRGGRERALEAGPPHVNSGDGYPALFSEAGFDEIDQTDLTSEFEVTFRAWIDAWDEESDGIASLIGPEEFQERQSGRRETLVAIEDGLLVRYLVTAVRPSL